MNSVSKENKHEKYRSVLLNMSKLLGITLVIVSIGEVMSTFGISNQIIIMLYLLAVQLISVVVSHYTYCILAAILCTFAYDFQITEPRLGFSFTIGLPIILFFMLAVTTLTSKMTASIKESAVLASKREQRANQLYEINQKLLAARSLDAIIDISKEYLTSFLQCPAVLYTSEQIYPTFQSYDAESIIALNDSNNGMFNVPIVSKGNMLGVIEISREETSFNDGEIAFIQMLVGQVALALELQYLADKQAQIIVETEKEKMRSSLLSSISHDLRTPLTGILGTSTTIIEQKNLDFEVIKNLANDIKHHVEWLISMVENILMITRISKDNLKIKKEILAAEEVLSEAVFIIRKRFPDHSFSVNIPENLLLIPMDGTLILQVLINLLENAAKNSAKGSLILVALKKEINYAKFTIIDNGTGIPKHLLDNLFEIHSTIKDQFDDVPQSTRLGLSICKTIVAAHSGTIKGHNRNSCGAEFSFVLPLSEVGESQ